MVFKYLIFLEILSHLYVSAPLLRPSYQPHIPESKKLEVKFTRDGDPMIIKSDRPLDEVFTSHPAYEVNSTMIKDSRKKKQELSNYNPMIEPDPPVLHLPAEPIVIERPYIVREHQDEPEVEAEPEIKDDYVAFVSPFQKRDGITDPILNVFKSIQGNLYGQNRYDDPDLEEVSQNLKILETDLEKALEEKNSEASSTMDSKTVRMIESYLKHVDYIHKRQQGKIMNEKPDLPDWYYYVPPEVDPRDATDPNLFLDEDIQKRLEELHKEIDIIDQTMDNYRRAGGYEQVLSDLSREKFEKFESIDRLEMGFYEEENVKETENLVELEQKEEELRNSGSDDGTLANIEQNEGVLIMEKDQTAENIAAVRLRGLRSRYLQIQEDLSMASSQDLSTSQLQRLKDEKQSIINQETALIDKVDVERLQELENELKIITEKESMLLNQQGTFNQMNELEHTKEAIVLREEEIKKQIKEPTPDAVNEIIRNYDNSVNGQNSNNSSVEYFVNEKSSTEVPYSSIHSKIDVDGHVKVVNFENQVAYQPSTQQLLDQYNSLRGGSSDESDPNKEILQKVVQGVLSDPLELRLSKIDSYNHLADAKKQLNVLSNVYHICFANLPNTSESFDSSSQDMHENIKILQQLRTSDETFTKHSHEIETELYFLTQELGELNLDLDGMLSFYDLKDEYNSTVSVYTTNNLEYQQHKMKLDSIVQLYKNGVDQLKKDTNTLQTLNKLLELQFDLIALKKSDSGIDEVKKVDIASTVLRKINVIRNELANVIDEMKGIVDQIDKDRDTVKKLLADLSVLSKNASVNSSEKSSHSGVKIIMTWIFALVLVSII